MSALSAFAWVRFLVCIAVSCGLAWLAGFNFDHRDAWVALWAFVALGVSFELALET